MIHQEMLMRIRNDLPMSVVIATLGPDGPVSKRSEGRFRFDRPHCGQMQAIVNPRNNLAHCFNCSRNLNNIDLLMKLGYDFKTAVATLERWLLRHESRLPKETKTMKKPLSHCQYQPQRDGKTVASLSSKILKNSGNHLSTSQNQYSLNSAQHATTVRSGTSVFTTQVLMSKSVSKIYSRKPC